MMWKKTLTLAVFGLALGLGACTDPNNQGQRAVGGGDSSAAPPVLARLSQLGPDLKNFTVPWCRKSSEHAGPAGANRLKPAAVPTNPLAKRPAALEGWRHVSTPQAAPQGRQGTPL